MASSVALPRTVVAGREILTLARRTAQRQNNRQKNRMAKNSELIHFSSSSFIDLGPIDRDRAVPMPQTHKNGHLEV